MRENKTIEIKLKKGQNLKLIGVNHGGNLGRKNIPSDFIIRKDFYENEIEKADLIILEQPIGGEFYHDLEFFGKIGKLVYKRNKPIYILDPINSIIVEKYSEIIKEEFNFFGLATKYLWEIMKGKCDFNNEKEFEKFITNSPPISGHFDWRNIKIAKSLDKKISKINFDNAIAFHGLLHTKQIEFYLLQRELRESRNKSNYNKLNEIGEKGIKKYTPLGESFMEELYFLFPNKFWKKKILLN